MPTQREDEGRKPYYEVEALVSAKEWVRLPKGGYRTLRGALQRLYRPGIIFPRRIIRVHPGGRREVVW